MALRGDFSILQNYIARLESLGDALPEIADNAAPKLAQSIDNQFAYGLDPYGTPWAALMPSTLDKGRGPPPLTDTGAMRASVQVWAEGPVINASVAMPADYHQSGTSRMAARPILPTDDGGVPPAWGEIIDIEAIAVLTKRLGE